MDKKNIKLFIKKYWKRLLLGTFIFIIIYTKYTSERVVREIYDFSSRNEFLHYSLMEYIVYFSKNGYETSYAVGNEFMTDNNAFYNKNVNYTDHCFGISGKKDGGYVLLNYIESVNDDGTVFPDSIYWITQVNDEKLPLIYGVEWGDTYQEVKRKMGLNIFNSSLPRLRFFNETIRCRNKEHIGISSSKLDYDYDLWFDDDGRLEEINIWSHKLKQQ